MESVMRRVRPRFNLISVIAITVGILAINDFVKADTNERCDNDIKAVIKSYEKALNNSDIEDVIKLYAKDGVFMPSTKPTSVGHKHVSAAYKHVFSALDLNVQFHFDEIIRRGNLAFVRTTSDGKITLLNKETTINNHSRELFVMKRIKNDWKIYRYMFNEST